MCAYLAVIAVFKMIYQVGFVGNIKRGPAPFQLQHIPDFGQVNIGGPCNASQSFSDWLGVQKAEDTWKLLNVGVAPFSGRDLCLGFSGGHGGPRDPVGRRVPAEAHEDKEGRVRRSQKAHLPRVHHAGL